MEDICKVCRLGTFHDRPLFHPCRCTGSIKYVHQDCLMQWLRHSGKQYCELCHHKFQFASVYRHDMPKWIPINDIYQSIMRNVVARLGRWLQFGFVIFMWLFLVPVVTYRIYKCMIYSSIWSLFLLPVRIFTVDDLLFDCLLGIAVVALCLFSFISLVWLKDQLSTGESPNWLTNDRTTARVLHEEELKHKTESRNEALNASAAFKKSKQDSPDRVTLNRDLQQLESQIQSNMPDYENACLQWRHDEGVTLRIREMTLMYDLGLSIIQYQPLLRRARLKHMKGVEKWRKGILDRLRAEGRIPRNVEGLPTAAFFVLRDTPLPSHEKLGLDMEESAVIDLFNRSPNTPEHQETAMEELHCVQADLKKLSLDYIKHQQQLMRALTSSEGQTSGLTEEDQQLMTQFRTDTNSHADMLHTETVLIDDTNKEARRLHPQAVPKEVWMERMFRRRGRRGQQQQEQGRLPQELQGRQPPPPPPQQQHNRPQDEQQQQRRRPNIGQALVGLARDPQDANAEALQADQLMRMVGLDGSFRFLEHVIWLTVLVSLIVFTFVYIPYCIGSFTAWMISLWKKIGIENWQTLMSVLFGYCLILGSVVVSYYIASAVKIYRLKPALGIIYLALKICFLLFLEAGIFPLLCGWWIDICAFSLLGSNLKIREESLNSAPGTIMFLHWLAGMIFVFYFASLVVLLREVLRPGVLWFLRNLNDQNFHPIQDMILQPFQRHMRRFLMSNIMFGVSIMVVILIPGYIATHVLPGFLPYNLTLISSVSPVREIQLELILLQFVIPTLLEHSNARMVIKKLVKHWSNFVAKTLGLHSYLLDGPQTGGSVVDIHGNPIRELEYDPDWDGPVYVGETQTLGPGYAPFKPYLRPKYFMIRIMVFMVLLIATILSTSTFFLVVPILIGRGIMLLAGIATPPDVYTASIGIYVLWISGRALSSVTSLCSRGNLYALSSQVLFWIKQGMKCVIAGVLLFVVIPLLLGHIVNLLIISPLRVPHHKTPLFYLTTEWALGLLHMKCTCGIIWLTDTSFKRTLDVLYQNGARNLNLSFVVREVVSPVVSNLVLCLAIPYFVFMGVFRYLGIMPVTTCYVFYRYCYPVVLLLLVTMVIVLVVVKQSHNLYSSIRNEKYLVGRQLMNFGSTPTFEVSALSAPVEETREQ